MISNSKFYIDIDGQEIGSIMEVTISTGLKDGDIVTISGYPDKYIVYGGCAGGGKSIFMKAWLEANEIEYKENLPLLKKLTAQYNRARATRNKHLEKELLLKIKELGG